MTASARYDSPLGPLWLTADDRGLTGLWFDGDRWFASPAPGGQADAMPVLAMTRRWLDVYFSGREPDFMPPLHLAGTPFRQAVWALLRQIPYGQTTTYGTLARTLAAQAGKAQMSAQAIGGAVGHNPIGILVPCHRVVGANGNLTGYAGGLDKKVGLLRLEGLDMGRFAMPKPKQSR